MRKINKIVIANRGEIALRIMRSCKEMGIATVAVFSEADRSAPFVRFADEAVCIGLSPSAESYLRGEKIIEICKKLQVDAIHPGYGFLSENADFARNVEKNGIIFIGPPATAMEMMGDKLSAKVTAKKYNIPMVPGTDGAINDITEAKHVAKKIGFPVLIKASAGGGGKGMRVVENEKDLDEEVKRASSEAQSAFGDGAVFIEKYVDKPRHIEIQILADKYENVIYLFERECSIQRRHQKVIEEAPSVVLTPEIRKQMGECAVSLAKACRYVGAGTVEFLVDANKNFYFLEVNTRLQVEHPVTEMITGLDLVREQIKIAQGEKLGIKQSDLKIEGHSIEVRVYAEDPLNNFLPDIGKLLIYKAPQGPGVRVDDGFDEGMTIPVYYDSMISKLIVHGSSREEAIARMIRAIEDYKIVGVETTLPFCKYVLKHEAFTSGHFDTNFVNNHFNPEDLSSTNKDEALVASLIAKNVSTSRIYINYQSTAHLPKSTWKLNR